MSIHVSTNKFMDVKFIAQGLDPERSHPIGGIIIDALNQDEYNTFSAFVAFASTGGIENIKDQLVAFKIKIEEVIFDCISALICTVHQKRLSTN